MELHQRQNRITTAFLLLSVLLHLLLLLIPETSLFPRESRPDPVYVEMRPTPARDRELDLPIRPELEKPREEPAKRLAEANQVVEKEMAPEGEDLEDSPKVTAQASKPVPTQTEPPAAETQPQPETRRAEPEKRQALERPVAAEADHPLKTRPGEETKPVPDLESLTQLSPTTLAKIERDWRQKYRADVEKGDTVWMDTEYDLLSSFMRRFRDNIYLVWNYPAAAAERQRQGTCLLRITVDREGNVTDVRLLESTGFRELDEEAMRAVRQGASYGPLPRAYPNDDLKIMAFFQYRMGSSYQRRRRAGDIY